MTRKLIRGINWSLNLEETGASVFWQVWILSQSRRLPLLQVVSNNKSFSVGVQSPTEINAPRGCAVILRRICQLSLTRITHQVSPAFDLNALQNFHSSSVFTDLILPQSEIHRKAVQILHMLPSVPHQTFH